MLLRKQQQKQLIQNYVETACYEGCTGPDDQEKSCIFIHCWLKDLNISSTYLLGKWQVLHSDGISMLVDAKILPMTPFNPMKTDVLL